MKMKAKLVYKIIDSPKNNCKASKKEINDTTVCIYFTTVILFADDFGNTFVAKIKSVSSRCTVRNSSFVLIR